MKLINWVTHPSYDIPLPQRHRFTSSKFSDLFTELQCSSLIKSAKINSPSKADEDDLLVAHCATYISKIKFPNGSTDGKINNPLSFKTVTPSIASKNPSPPS